MRGAKRTKILIVDDEPSSLELLAVYLRDKGFAVECAVNGAECADKVLSFVPDIVILDVRLPDKDGIEILKELRTGENPPYIIIVTAFHDMDTTIKAIRSGAFEYIPKPIDVDELERAIERALKLSKTRRTRARTAPAPAKRFRKDEMIGNTREMNEIFKTIGVLSANRVTVLVEGETGTGKELVARAIHFHSSYKDQPFMAINCSAIVENLLESELFGHEKGAFTGAVSVKKGMLELAEKGTVFLDEVAEMPLELQAKLLRVLQEWEYQRVGGQKTLQFKARVIAATNKNLAEMVQEGRFREDLFYRLSVATVRIPPLRDRKSDIPLIIDHLVQKINTELDNQIVGVDAGAIRKMIDYPWPGNVRELENILTKAALRTKGDIIQDDVIDSLLPRADATAGKERKAKSSETEPQTERERIIRILNEAHWHYGRACELLGVSRPTLSKKMKTYSIPSRPRHQRNQ